MTEKQESKHHFLITGEIVFTQDEGDIPNAIRINGVLVHDKETIDVATLGKCQQILQLNFHQRMQEEKIQVVDVVIYHMTYLGHMTQEEFHKEPEGMKLQEKKTDTAPEAVDLDQAVAQANRE